MLAFLSLQKFTTRCHPIFSSLICIIHARVFEIDTWREKQMESSAKTKFTRAFIYSAHLLWLTVTVVICGYDRNHIFTRYPLKCSAIFFISRSLLLFLLAVLFGMIPLQPTRIWNNRANCLNKKKETAEKTRLLNFLIYAYCGGAFFALLLLLLLLSSPSNVQCTLHTIQSYTCAFHCCLSLYFGLLAILYNAKYNWITVPNGHKTTIHSKIEEKKWLLTNRFFFFETPS